jgi:acyl-coenzyme A synthetase/AMP-(fatty) acid ligase
MFNRIIEYQSRFRPDQVAISTPLGDATFRQLNDDVNRMARRLAPVAPPRGFVAVQTANPGLHWVVLLALARLGCVTASLPAVGERPEAELLDILAPDLLVTDRPATESTVPSFPLSPEWVEETFKSSAEPVAPYAFDQDDPVRIVLSSGTTGTPKKMVLTLKVVEARILFGGLSMIAHRRLHVAIGLDTETGFRGPLVAWGTGFPIVYPQVGFAWSDFLARARLDAVLLVPIQLDQLLRTLPADFRRQDSLSLIVVSGSLPASLYERASARLTSTLFVTYGSTEAGYTSTSSPWSAQSRGLANIVTPMTEVQIVDDNDQPLPAGVTGLIRVRSEEMVSGYLGDDALTREHFKDGWFYPGDVGSVSSDGLLQVLGRTNEVFDFGGLRIAPMAIEEVLLACEGVRDAGAFTVEVDGIHWPRAAVVCDPGCELEDVKGRLRRERPQLPILITVVDHIPRSDRGKIMRDKLRDQVHGL